LDKKEDLKNTLDSDAKDSIIFSDGNSNSALFNSGTTQNTTLDNSTIVKKKAEDSSQKKKAALIRPPPPFKMQKDTINFTNPTALFENSSCSSHGKSSGLFD